MKRNEQITRLAPACLAVLALVCMSMVPSVKAAARSTTTSSGTLEPSALQLHTGTHVRRMTESTVWFGACIIEFDIFVKVRVYMCERMYT